MATGSQQRATHGNEYPSIAVRWVLEPFFRLITYTMSYTLVRVCCASFLFPAYILVAFCRSIMLSAIRNASSVVSSAGRETLVAQGREWREWRNKLANSQLDGTFKFDRKDLENVESYGMTQRNLHDLWSVHRDYFDVCGVRACVVHEKPVGTPKRQVVLLHGNPSWSYMYRNVVSHLIEEGYEVFALDLVGMGGSEKILNQELITFELQMRAMIQLYEKYDLHQTYVLAHDWGGCVALCTIPELPSNACSGVFFLNSFFPARPHDISIHYYLLYLCWLSCQGLFGGRVPENVIMRFMSPEVATSVASGYAAPFPGPQCKGMVTKLARFVPGMPDAIYDIFEGRLGALVDGMCPRDTFSSLWTQIRLKKRNERVREIWSSEALEVRVEVAFGELDPLLVGFFDVLVETIQTKQGRPQGYWIKDAGHYPTEERPEAIARLFADFVAPKEKEMT